MLFRLIASKINNMSNNEDSSDYKYKAIIREQKKQSPNPRFLSQKNTFRVYRYVKNEIS